MNLYLEEAEKARAKSQFKKAQGIYSRLLRKKGLDAEQKIEAYLGLADVERIQGLFPQALAHYQQANRLFKGHHGKTCWDAQVGWALAARACGHPKEALGILQKALAVYRKEKDLEGQAFAHWALGGTLRISGDMKGGLKELLTALEMFKSLKDSEGVAYTCCALGGIYRMLGRYFDSGKYYREANRRMRQRKDTFGIAYSYCGLGNVERMAGRFHQALPFYRKAERLYGTIGDRVSYAYTLWSIGTAYKMLGQYTQAHRAFQKADNLFKKTGDARGRIYSLLGFAEIEFLKGRFKKGLMTYWRQAEKLSDKGEFAWEKIHINALLKIDILQRFQRVREAYTENEWKKANIELKNALRFLSGSYQKAGSSFNPTSLPINWP